MSLIFKSMSWSSSDPQDNMVNSEGVNFPNIQHDLENWKLPKTFSQEIYRKGYFKFFSNYIIKTVEQT